MYRGVIAPVLAAACLAAGPIWWSQRPETSTVSVGTDSAAPAASQTSGLPAGESFDGVATVGRFVLTYANADRQGKEQRDSVAYMSLDGGRTFERSKAFPNDAFRLAVGASGPNEFLVVGSTCTAVSDEEQLPCGLGDRLTIRYDAVADSVSAVDPAPAGDVWDLIDDDTTIGPVAVITGPEGLVTAFALSNDQKWAPIELPKSTSALCGTRNHLVALTSDQAVVTTPTTPLETIPVAPGGETATWTAWSDSGDGWSVVASAKLPLAPGDRSVSARATCGPDGTGIALATGRVISIAGDAKEWHADVADPALGFISIDGWLGRDTAVIGTDVGSGSLLFAGTSARFTADDRVDRPLPTTSSRSRGAVVVINPTNDSAAASVSTSPTGEK